MKSNFNDASQPGMTTFYDTHAHLDFPDFARDLPETLERATNSGISKSITIGTDFESSR